MRAGLPVSVAFHIALAFAGVAIAPYAVSPPPSEMMLLPVELLTIAETTNVKPTVADEAKAPDPKATELKVEDAPKEASEKPKAEAPSPAAAPTPQQPEKAPEVIPDPNAKKDKPEPTPKPKAPDPAPNTFNSKLQSILKDVDKTKKDNKSPQKTSADRTAADAAARKGVGDQKQMTIMVQDFITQQMYAHGCWRGAADMPDAQRLQAVIRVRFRQDGTFERPPELQEPSHQPSADMPMQTFIQRAFRALKKCEPFEVPKQYFQGNFHWVDITFLPGK